MKVRFVAGFSPIVDSAEEGRSFWGGKLTLPLLIPDPERNYTEVELPGVKHFGLWALSDAAMSVFGKSEWPSDVPRPQATIELEVDDVEAAVEELRGRGLELIQGARLEPWGQSTARLLSPEGLLVGVTYTPWFRDDVPEDRES